MNRKADHAETKVARSAADLHKKNGPMALPIYQTSTFEVTDNDEQLRVTGSDSYYTRYGNPTNSAAEKTVAGPAGADAALTFSSALAAITTSILALPNGGDPTVPQRAVRAATCTIWPHWRPGFGGETRL